MTATLTAERSELMAMSLQSSSSFDFNNAARMVMAGGLNKVPNVGFVLSALTNVLWPVGQDVWDTIRKRVEALVNQRLSDYNAQQLRTALKGLKANVNEYLVALKYSSGNVNYISEKYNVALGHFIQQVEYFKTSDFTSQQLLLPLFAQFSNLHLSLLRDGVIHGRNWGWTTEVQQYNRTRLADTIVDYIDHVEKTYTTGLDTIRRNTSNHNRDGQPFRNVNRYVREMTLAVLDFKDMWKYLDPVNYPNPVDVVLDREIYSDPVGTADDTGIAVPGAPTQPLTWVEVWGWDRIDAVLTAYASGGPDGRNNSGRMGNGNGGSNSGPYGGKFDLNQRGPIVEAGGQAGDILNALWFNFKDGSSTGKLGGKYPGGNGFSFKYEDHILSSIKVMGVSKHYRSANCAVFGFKHDKAKSPMSAEMAQLLYVASIADTKALDLARVSEDSDGAVRRWAEDYEWARLRDHIWAQRKQESSLR